MDIDSDLFRHLESVGSILLHHFASWDLPTSYYRLSSYHHLDHADKAPATEHEQIDRPVYSTSEVRSGGVTSDFFLLRYMYISLTSALCYTCTTTAASCMHVLQQI